MQQAAIALILALEKEFAASAFHTTAGEGSFQRATLARKPRKRMTARLRPLLKIETISLF
jgi:hypothetical protein